jgi:ComEC/Rec2-related protein
MKSSVRRPMIGMALAVVAGTFAGLVLPPAALPLAAAAVVLLGLAGSALFRPRRSPSPGPATPSGSGPVLAAGLHAAVFAAACLNARVAGPLPAAGWTRPLAPRSRLCVTGVVADEPVWLAPSGNRPARLEFPLVIERPAGASLAAAADGTLWVRFTPPERGHRPRYGERWEIRGRRRAGGSSGRKPGVFEADGSASRFLSAGHGSRLMEYSLAARAAASRMLTRGIAQYPRETGLLRSLLLGYRHEIARPLYAAFARTGTVHIFAISGSHVVVLAAILISALSASGIPRTRWVLFLGPLLGFYTIMTGLQPSAVRACIMAVVFWLAPLLHRRPDTYSALGFAAVLILAVVPSDLFDIGFVLSFAVVLGLIMFYPMMYAPLRGVWVRDPLRVQPERRVVSLMRDGWEQIIRLVAASLAAWLASAPLTAWYFGLFSPIGLLGNLIIIPLASVVILCGCLSILAGSLLALAGECFNYANLVLASAMIRVTQAFDAIPFGWFAIAAPPAWLVVAYYAVLLLAWARFSVRQPTRDQGKYSAS